MNEDIKDKATSQEELHEETTQPQVEQDVQELETEEVEQPDETEPAEPSDADKIADLQQKLQDAADQRLRMMAEFDNFRRRTAREKLELEKTAGERIFKDMLPLIDDFERARQAMQQSSDIEALREGVDLIYQKFLTFLEQHEVRQIQTDNANFDTEFHEAITTFPAPTPEQKGKVIDCTQKGYTLSDKVIRYAKVVVGE